MALRKIRNTRTGEVKLIDDSQAAEYGLPPGGGPQTTQTASTGGGVDVDGLLKTFGLQYPAELAKTGFNTMGQIGDIFKGQFGNEQQKKEAGKSFLDRQRKIGESAKKMGYKSTVDEKTGKETISTIPTKKSVTKAGQAASWAVPAAKGPLATKMLASGTMGALQEAGEDDATATSIATSAGVSAATTLPFEFGGWLVKKLQPQAKKLLLNVFKPSVDRLMGFEKNTGKKFIDEVLVKDMPNLIGKSADEIALYLDQQREIAEQLADKHLAGKKLKAYEVFKILAEANKETKGRILQDEAKNELLRVAKQYLGILPDDFIGINTVGGKTNAYAAEVIRKLSQDVDATLVNQMKRDIRDNLVNYTQAGKIGVNAADRALHAVERGFGDILDKAAPGYKKINYNTMYRNLVSDAFVKNVNKAGPSRDIFSEFINRALLPTLLGGITGLALAGDEAGDKAKGAGLGLAGGIGSGALIYKFNQPKTKIEIAKKIMDLTKTSKAKQIAGEAARKATSFMGGELGAIFGK